MQVEHIREQLALQDSNGAVTVDTAHGFQGDEKQVMIFSLVLGDQMPPGTILWVHNLETDSKNLLNVALTRAQKELHIVGNKELCRRAGGLLKLLVEYVDNKRVSPK
jgi:superfamily I DNA and/or RNA helicase